MVHFRTNLAFHNGAPLDADAVAWDLNCVMTRNDIQIYPAWKFAKDVNVIDPVIVEVVTDAPKSFAVFFVVFNGCVLRPLKYMEEAGEAAFGQNLVGSKPFRHEKFITNERYELVAWDDYWAGRPEIDRVERAPGIEFMRSYSGELSHYRGRVQVKTGDMAATYPDYLPSILDVRISEAISHALDRQTRCEIQGAGRPRLICVFSVAAEQVGPWSTEQAAIDYYDPKLVRDLILEAG